MSPIIYNHWPIKQVYNIKASDELARYTTHSIRVGACVLLHETSQTPDFIKAHLRWRSDAYLMYLRNPPKFGFFTYSSSE